MKLDEALVEERGAREKRWSREDIEVPEEEKGDQLRGRARDGQVSVEAGGDQVHVLRAEPEAVG
eukprot:7491118-Pyramimonas_sp.AAC.1